MRPRPHESSPWAASACWPARARPRLCAECGRGAALVLPARPLARIGVPHRVVVRHRLAGRRRRESPSGSRSPSSASGAGPTRSIPAPSTRSRSCSPTRPWPIRRRGGCCTTSGSGGAGFGLAEAFDARRRPGIDDWRFRRAAERPLPDPHPGQGRSRLDLAFARPGRSCCRATRAIAARGRSRSRPAAITASRTWRSAARWCATGDGGR